MATAAEPPASNLDLRLDVSKLSDNPATLVVIGASLGAAVGSLAWSAGLDNLTQTTRDSSPEDEQNRAMNHAMQEAAIRRAKSHLASQRSTQGTSMSRPTRPLEATSPVVAEKYARQSSKELAALEMAAQALSAVADDATDVEGMKADCESGYDVACDELSREDAAKKAWLEKLDASEWVAAAATASKASDVATAAALTSRPIDSATAARIADVERSREDTKAAWLTTVEETSAAWLDAPALAKAADAVAEVAADAGLVAEMTEACEAGSDVACENLTREDAAKAAWLAKLDAPTLGAAAAATSAASRFANAAADALASEEAAVRTLLWEKVLWMAKAEAARAEWIGAPALGKAADAIAEVAATEAAQLAETTGIVEPIEGAANDDEATRDPEAQIALPTRRLAWTGTASRATVDANPPQPEQDGGLSRTQSADRASQVTRPGRTMSLTREQAANRAAKQAWLDRVSRL